MCRQFEVTTVSGFKKEAEITFT